MPRTRAALVFALLWPTFVTVAFFVVLAGHPAGPAPYVIGKTIQFAFPLIWVLLVMRQRLHITGPTRHGIPGGLLFGLAVAGAMLLLYHFALKPLGLFAGPDEAIRTRVMQLGLDTMEKFVAAAVFYSVAHSFLEEYYWRWFVFGGLRELIALPAAIVLSSVGFMAHHVIVLAIYFGPGSALTYLFSLGVAIGGAIWAWLYHRSNSLYGPWLSHLLVDAAIFAIGYDLVWQSLHAAYTARGSV